MNDALATLPYDELSETIEAADSARDARRWRDAAASYEHALTLQPDDTGLLIQLAHMFKESGQFARAEAAYRQAAEREPASAELMLQLGHFFATQGVVAEAAEYYRHAVALGSQDMHALHYLSKVGVTPDQRPAQNDHAVPVIYFDLSDLVVYFRGNRFPTGIQRMESELFKASRGWQGQVPIQYCAFSGNANAWVELDPALFGALCDGAGCPGSVDDRDWQDALAAFLTAFDQQSGFKPPPGAAMINLGPHWAIEYMQLLRMAKARFGLRYIPFVHDVIPMLTPEDLPPGTNALFSHWLASALLHADAIACNSVCTQRDLLRVAGPLRDFDVAPLVVPLDAVYTVSGEWPEAPSRRDILERSGVTGPFALFVGTLEARKNHLLVFRAWSRLIEDEGADAIPALVCVGKPGWAFAPARHYLDTHTELAGKVIILSGLSDIELHSLYAECLFTIFASAYEGWGLPVTEALSHGKICLTANHSALPEAGGSFARYYEGDSVGDFCRQARRLMFDADDRLAGEALIREGYKPRSWGDVLDGLITGLLPRLQSPARTGLIAAPVTLGTIYRLRFDGDLGHLDRDVAVAEMLRAGHDWHGIDPQRVWAITPEAKLSFALPQERRPMALLVTLRVRAAKEPQHLTVRLGATVLGKRQFQPDEVRTLRFSLLPAMLARDDEPHPHATLRLLVDHMVNMQNYDPYDIRVVGIAVELFSVCWADDVVSRLALLEDCMAEL